jgi:hypothetical protein
LVSRANGARYYVGVFSTPSLGALRERVAVALALDRDGGSGGSSTGGGASECDGKEGEASGGAGGGGGGSVLHGGGGLRLDIVLGDVAKFHGLRENRHATFQAASQFNCLEFVGPSVVPEDGIMAYPSDKTQGPACSVACGPATTYRNYLVPLDDGAQVGQTSHRQIENMSGLAAMLEHAPRVQGGYTLAENGQLVSLNEELKGFDEEGVDALRSVLAVGVHEDVQVRRRRDVERER